MNYWQAFVAWLASLTADASQIHLEPPRASAAIMVARASMAEGPQPKPDDNPDNPQCDCPCVGGWIVHGDGHRTPCACPDSCECRKDG